MRRIHPRKPRNNRIGERGKERWKKLAGRYKHWQRSCSRACSRDEDRLEETEEDVKEEEWFEELEEVAGRCWGASGSSNRDMGGSSGSRVSGNPGAAAPGPEVPGVVSGPALKVPDVDPRLLKGEQAVRRPPIVQIWTMDEARFQNWEKCQVGFPPLFDYNCA